MRDDRPLTAQDHSQLAEIAGGMRAADVGDAPREDAAGGRSWPRFLYVIATEDNSAVKIGVANDVNRRLTTIQACCPWPLRVVIAWAPAQRYGARSLEQMIHRWLRPAWLHHEWFDGTHPFIAEWLKHDCEIQWLVDAVLGDGRDAA